MKAIAVTAALAVLPGIASAHVADMPLLLHAIEHGWILLAIAPLPALLLPLIQHKR